MLKQTLSAVGRGIVQAYAGLIYHVDAQQLAPLPQGAKIIAPNHPTTIDPALILALLGEQASVLIEDRLFKVPALGHCLRQTGQICVVPGRGREAFDEAVRVLESGGTVVIFPEGHISPLGGGYHPARTGVSRLALATGAPVIPAGIHVDRSLIRLHETLIEGQAAVGTWYLHGPYGVTLGEPMRLTGDLEDRDRVRMLAEQVLSRIAQLAALSRRRVEAAPMHWTVALSRAGHAALNLARRAVS